MKPSFVPSLPGTILIFGRLFDGRHVDFVDVVSRAACCCALRAVGDSPANRLSGRLLRARCSRGHAWRVAHAWRVRVLGRFSLGTFAVVFFSSSAEAVVSSQSGAAEATSAALGHCSRKGRAGSGRDCDFFHCLSGALSTTCSVVSLDWKWLHGREAGPRRQPLGMCFYVTDDIADGAMSPSFFQDLADDAGGMARRVPARLCRFRVRRHFHRAATDRFVLRQRRI